MGDEKRRKEYEKESERALDRNEVSAELAAARSAAIDVLASNADDEKLRKAGRRLARVLSQVADDNQLWKRFEATSGQIRGLDEQQRGGLEIVLRVDWAPLLDGLGYVPPPPSPAISDQLVLEMSKMLSGETVTSPELVRDHLRSFTARLDERCKSPDVFRVRLRRCIRRALPVAAHATIVLVVGTAAGLTVGSVLPGIGHGMGAAWGVAVANGAMDMFKDSVIQGLDSVLDRVGWSEISDADEKDTEDRIAFDAVRAIDLTALGKLHSNWKLLAQRPHEGPDVSEVVEATRNFVARTTTHVYSCWSASLGAKWADQEFFALCVQLSDALRSVRNSSEDWILAERVVDGLAEVSTQAQALAQFMDRAVGHRAESDRDVLNDCGGA